jgi:hypothetical protein
VIPHTCAVTQVQEAIEEARRFIGSDTLVLVILHHFDFVESGSGDARMDLGSLGELLHWIDRQSDIRKTTLSELAGQTDPAACGRNLRLAHHRGKLHWRLQALFPRYTMISGSASRFVAAITGGGLRRLPKALAG